MAGLELPDAERAAVAILATLFEMSEREIAIISTLTPESDTIIDIMLSDAKQRQAVKQAFDRLMDR